MEELKVVRDFNKLKAAEEKLSTLRAEYGLVGDPDTVIKFLDRLEKNRELQAACRAVKKERIDIWLKKKFKVDILGVRIDIFASDKEIIRFLTKTTNGG